MHKLLKNDNIRGAVWMLGFILNITIMAISIRELSFKYSSFEIQNFRNIFSIIIILIIYVLKSNTQIKTYPDSNQFYTKYISFYWSICMDLGFNCSSFSSSFFYRIYYANLGCYYISNNI